MRPWPDTQHTLLARLTDPADHEAWEEFARIYEPLIYRFACSRGLQEADARDVTQRVLWTVARAAENWQSHGGRFRFRGWLARVTTNAVINLVTRERRHCSSGSTTIRELLEQTPERDEELTSAWLLERRRQLFRYAASRVRPHVADDTWQAFWATTVDGQTGESVAKQLNKSIGAIYAAKSRVLARIRQVWNASNKRRPTLMPRPDEWTICSSLKHQ